MELHQVLEATVSASADKSQLEAANKYLEQAAQANLPEFLVALSNELGDASRDPAVRTAAGLYLKNLLTAREDRLRVTYQERWLAIPAQFRQHIKVKVLQTLAAEQSSAPQCVSAIAYAELPRAQWPDLIPTLVQNVSTTTNTETLKASSLEAIGYMCEDIAAEALSAQANNILTAIICGMRKEEPVRVRLAGVQALLNSLQFTRGNFEVEQERHYIMQTVCETTQCPNTKVRTVALQCLVRIMSLYYTHMHTYMGPALFGITVEAMKSQDDDVALQGIEFWSTVAEEEIDLALDAQDAQEYNREVVNPSHGFAKGALQFIVPVLMARLAQQEEFDDEDEWNPSKSAGVCLGILASCCENEIVNLVLPFVREHIANQDWRFRDAAVMAFGSILDGPDPQLLTPVVSEAMLVLIQRMSDPSVIVRDSTAWALGRVCELYPDVVIEQTCLEPLLTTLLGGLGSEPRVAVNCCWAFTSLAEAAYLKADVGPNDDEPATCCLSPVFQSVVEKLLEVTNRGDAGACNLRSAAYEAVMELIKNSPRDCYHVVQATTVTVLQRIQELLLMSSQVTANNRSQYNDLQSFLCALLQTLLRRISVADASQLGENIFQALIAMLQASTTGTVQEDALSAVGALIELLGETFLPFLAAFKPFLLFGLRSKQEPQLCTTAVGLVGDLSRAIGCEAMVKMLDEIMEALVSILSDGSVVQSVKPHVISIFGDVALAVGVHFQKYLAPILTILSQASSVQYDKADQDMAEYMVELRESVLVGYTGILQGLMGEDKKPSQHVLQLQPHLAGIVGLIETMAADTNHTEENIATACGLLGDLCRAFGKDIVSLVNKATIMTMLQDGRHSKSTKTKTFATYASREIRSLN